MSWDSNDHNQPTEWINGVVNILPTLPTCGYTYVASIFVNGSDVYKAGKANGHAVYWINGSRIPLDVTGFIVSEAKSIYVSGSDVYVVGSGQVAGINGSFPFIWKNGIRTVLEPIVSNSANCRAESVFVKGTDVYVAVVFK